MARPRSVAQYPNDSSLPTSAKALIANIRLMNIDDSIDTIVITSAVPSEGKTFISAHLANAIATAGEQVLLVECDLRRRSLARLLGIHASDGLLSVVTDQVPLAEAVMPTKTPGLFFLDAEPRIPNPSDLLGSRRFQEFKWLASESYDYVIFDTPPVGTFVDAVVVGAVVDAVFMVARENYVQRTDLVMAADQLTKAGCNLAGVIMNCCEHRETDYYYSDYHDRGHGLTTLGKGPSHPLGRLPRLLGRHRKKESA